MGDNRANCDGCGSQWDNEKTAPVGSFEANPWGLYDTAGNIQEWTCSVFEGDYGGAEQCIDNDRVGRMAIRSGSWFYYPSALRVAARSWSAPDWRFSYIGFRLARDYGPDS